MYINLYIVYSDLTDMSADNIDWNEVIKKEARGLKDDDLGEVQEVRVNDIITKVGVVDKETYCIPKRHVTRYDGHNLWFNITKDEAKNQYKIVD